MNDARRSGNDALTTAGYRLASLAAKLSPTPVVAGTVDDAGVLRGSHRGRRVRLSFARIDPSPSTGTGDEAHYVDVLEVRLEGQGGTPWVVRPERTFVIAGRRQYGFGTDDASTILGGIGLFAGLVPVADPAVERRLSEAGLLEALERIAPPSGYRLPMFRFTPDALPMARQRLGLLDPALLASPAADPAVELSHGLLLDLPRADLDGPSPDRLHAVLDAAVAVCELNAAVNPPRPA